MIWEEFQMKHFLQAQVTTLSSIMGRFSTLFILNSTPMAPPWAQTPQHIPEFSPKAITNKV